MAYELHSIDLFIFDFHLAPRPLAAPETLRDTMRWLVDADSYRQHYKPKAALQTTEFRIRPLAPKARTYHHFWKYYSRTSWDEEPDPWGLQLPFVVEPLKGNWEITGLPAGIEARIRPVVYLFAFGWSTHLEISFEGKMQPTQYTDLIGKLRTSTNQLLRADGKQLNLPGAFADIATKLRNDLFVGGGQGMDFLKVQRHMVESISRFDGPTRNYGSDSGEPFMPASDRASMHSCLLGRQVPPESIPAVEQGKKCLVTLYEDEGFALTYFEEGSLVFLPKKAIDRECRSAMRCLASNVRHCTMMLFALAGLYQETSKYAGKTDVIGKLRDAVGDHLQRLPDRYTNRFCRNWWFNYGPIQKLFP